MIEPDHFGSVDQAKLEGVNTKKRGPMGPKFRFDWVEWVGWVKAKWFPKQRLRVGVLICNVKNMVALPHFWARCGGLRAWAEV